jgi:RNA polymerase sigma-70 factor (ECF subfamily)
MSIFCETPAIARRNSERLGEIDASILMMYMDGLTADEMSGVLGITADAINVRINRLKQKFSDDYVV